MKIFEFAVIYNPKEKGQSPKIIVPITQTLAMDQQAATIKAGRSIPEEYMEKLDQLEVAVRPF